MDIIQIFNVIVFIVIFIVALLLFRGLIARLSAQARVNKRMVNSAKNEDMERRRRNIRVFK